MFVLDGSAEVICSHTKEMQRYIYHIDELF